MKREKRQRNVAELLSFYWRRLLRLVKAQAWFQDYDLTRRYARNAYARFPGVRRTMVFWWLDGIALWAAFLVLVHHGHLSASTLRVLFIPLWLVWFYVAYQVYQADALVMAAYREACQRSRFFKAELLKQARR